MQKSYPFLENVLSIDIDALCLSEKFGKFKFDDCVEPLKIIQGWANKFKTFDANFDNRGDFDAADVSDISSFFSEIFEFTQNIKNFNPTGFQNVIQIQDSKNNISSNILKYYGNNKDKICFKVIRSEQLYELDKVRKIIQEIEKAKDVSNLALSLSNHAEELKKSITDESDKARGDIYLLKKAQATNNLHQHFTDHLNNNLNPEVKSAFKKVKSLRIVNYILPVSLLVIVLLNKDWFDIKSLPIFILSSVIMSLAFYHLKSATRDLNVLKNTKDSYEQKAKVAETFITFLFSEGKNDEITKTEMAKQAAIAMFQRVPSGYLTKDQIEPVSHPLIEILSKTKN